MRSDVACAYNSTTDRDNGKHRVQCIPDCQSWPPTCCCLSPARGGKRVQQLFRNNYSAQRWSLSGNSAAETDCSSEMASYRCNPSESWYGYPRSSLMGIPTQCLDTLANLLQHGGKLSVRRCARRVQGLGYRTGLVGLRVGGLCGFFWCPSFCPAGGTRPCAPSVNTSTRRVGTGTQLRSATCCITLRQGRAY